MLQVTDRAVSVFKQVLEKGDHEGEGIRLVHNQQADGRVTVGIEMIQEPAPSDEAAQARGLTIVVAKDLAPELEDAVLDAEETSTGADLFVRPQQRPEQN
jgi:Fe-S cluster assembly iron-binding protein IscA